MERELGQAIKELEGKDWPKKEYTSDTERFVGAAISTLRLAQFFIQAATMAEGTSEDVGRASAEAAHRMNIMVQNLPKISFVSF